VVFLAEFFGGVAGGDRVLRRAGKSRAGNHLPRPERGQRGSQPERLCAR
jgi:hypothetical protein